MIPHIAIWVFRPCENQLVHFLFTRNLSNGLGQILYYALYPSAAFNTNRGILRSAKVVIPRPPHGNRQYRSDSRHCRSDPKFFHSHILFLQISSAFKISAMLCRKLSFIYLHKILQTTQIHHRKEGNTGLSCNYE